MSWEPELEELRRREALAREMGGEERVARQRASGRLKLNGHITGYSPLSRVVELEGLMTGITGKIGLWLALLELAPDEPRLDAPRLERLRERGESQRTTVEELRERAAREAFAG